MWFIRTLVGTFETLIIYKPTIVDGFKTTVIYKATHVYFQKIMYFLSNSTIVISEKKVNKWFSIKSSNYFCFSLHPLILASVLSLLESRPEDTKSNLNAKNSLSCIGRKDSVGFPSAKIPCKKDGSSVVRFVHRETT